MPTSLLEKVRLEILSLSCLNLTDSGFCIIGELKHIHKLKFWPLHSVLMDKYLIPESEAKYLESFLQPMLHLNPDKRAAARDMLDHDWLRGVVVQGEIEAHLLQTGEAEEERKRKVEEGKRVARSIKGMNVESPAVTNGTFSSLL